MSYKLSMILSMIFVVFFSLFATDLMVIQNTYSLLDSKSISISYFLSKNGDLSRSTVTYIKRTYDVDFTLVSSAHPAFGDNIIYNLSTTCKTFVVGDELKITIQRMTVVGYFN